MKEKRREEKRLSLVLHYTHPPKTKIKQDLKASKLDVNYRESFYLHSRTSLPPGKGREMVLER